jgi:hypothetical protein
MIAAIVALPDVKERLDALGRSPLRPMSVQLVPEGNGAMVRG